MILRYTNLQRYPRVFLAVTGLKLSEFAALFDEVLPLYAEAEQKRHLKQRPQQERQRALGGGHPFTLSVRDQLLLALVWLRIYPTHEVLGFLFGVSDSSVSRLVHRWLPLLAQAGRDEMRQVDPGRKHRRSLQQVLTEVPQLSALVDSFEQRVQRPADPQEQRAHYSGKKKAHTLKTQVVVQPDTGLFMDVSESVRGPTNDHTLVRLSGVLGRLPSDTVLGGDLGYVGQVKEPGDMEVSTPRRKPRGKERGQEDMAYNKAFAQVRIKVEHTIGRARRYQALSQQDRHHRELVTERGQAIAGLVNRQITTRLPYLLH
jgi:hypothetical protein